MSEKKRTIMLGFHSPVDGRLLREWLTGLGYEVVESLDDTADIDLVLMDSATARRLMDRAFELKREAKYFLPVLVCIDAGEDVGRWLKAGFDDVLRMPITKAEWQARIAIMLRLRWQSEELGQKSEASLIHTLQNMSDGFVSLDENWCYTYVNKKAGELLGRKPEDLIGKHIWTEFPEGIGQPFYKNYYKAVETQKEIFFEDYYSPWDRWFENRVFPSKKGLAIFFQDITERKQAEQALRQNRERLNHLFTVNPAIVYELDPENFSTTWVSPNITEITGYTPEEACQPGWWAEHVHPEDREETKKAHERLKVEDRVAHEYRFEKKDGTYFWVRDELRLLRDEHGTPKEIVGSWMNITDRKEAEKELAKSEQRYRSVVENTGTAMFIVNEDGSIAFANKQCTATTGYSPEELQGTDWRNYVSADDLPMMENYFRLWFTDPEKAPNSYEARLIHANGSIRNVLLTVGTIPGTRQIVVSILDITERKRAEDALRESEEKFRKAFTTSPDSININRLEDGMYVSINEGFTKITGYTESDVIGKTSLEINIWVNPEDREKLVEGLRKHDRVQNFEAPFRMKDGKIVYGMMSASVINLNGVPHIISITRDITERKQAEEELRKYREHLEELVKERTEELQSINKELEAFAYSVSHDLRAPLRAIDGFTRILMQEYVEKLDDEGKRLGDVIQKNAQKMGKLIDDLLAFSRLGRASMQFSNIDMKNMVIAIYHELTSSSERERIEFKVGDLPDAFGDTNMLRQVWMNLISNAIKFSSKREKAVISITGIQDDEKTTYSISDNGVGFDMQYVNKIFDVFQRLHRETEFPGTGVGLSLVKRIIHRHKGKVWAESEIDKGATFYFSLPNKVD